MNLFESHHARSARGVLPVAYAVTGEALVLWQKFNNKYRVRLVLSVLRENVLPPLTLVRGAPCVHYESNKCPSSTGYIHSTLLINSGVDELKLPTH